MQNINPENLDQVVDLIIAEAQKQNAEENIINEGIPHHGAGTSIRNNLSLWWQPNWTKEVVNAKGKIEVEPVPKPAIVDWFNKKNIYHADDMSGTIAAAVKAKLSGETFDVDEHLKIYFKHWADLGYKDGIFTPGKEPEPEKVTRTITQDFNKDSKTVINMSIKTTWDFEEEKAPCGMDGAITAHYLKYEKSTDLSGILAKRVESHPWWIIIWEELPIIAPPMKIEDNPFAVGTKVWCCYIRTVIFYKYPYRLPAGQRYGAYEAWAKCETRLNQEDEVAFEEEIFKVFPGTVVFANDKYWMRHPAKKNNLMKALTLKDYWNATYATWVEIGYKDIETRTWKPKGWKEGMEWDLLITKSAAGVGGSRGMAICVVTLFHVEEMLKEHENRAMVELYYRDEERTKPAYSWFFKNRRLLSRKFPVVGRLGIWECEIPKDVQFIPADPIYKQLTVKERKGILF